VRVMLVDDSWLVREGIARLLEDSGIEVVARLGDALDICVHAKAARADAVIIDVRMPPTFTAEGLQAAIDLKQTHPAMGVLVLSEHIETRHALELLSGGKGGVGYMVKQRITRPDELVSAVRRVAAGDTAIDAEVVRIVFDSPRREDPLERLTARERDVLALVSQGHSNDRIAQLLAINARTVETHTSRIFAKLGLEADESTHRRVLAVLMHLRAAAASLPH